MNKSYTLSKINISKNSIAKKKQNPHHNNEISLDLKTPCDYTLSIINGYASSLEIIKTSKFSFIEVILN